jgi:hypothetical protein
MIIKDDWEKPRSRQDYLTEDEIERLREAFDAGHKTCDIAGELNCSTRIAAKYYAQFRGTPLQRGRPKRRPASSPDRPSRFYKSNFEL